MKKKLKFKNILIIIISVYIVFTLVNQQIAMHKIKNQIEAKTQELQLIKQKNQRLQDEVKMSKSQKYIEKLARERLGFIKNGETPVINTKKN